MSAPADQRSPFLLPLPRRPRARETTTDENPVRVLWTGVDQPTSVASEGHSNDDTAACGVCQEHISRYTCPRCSLKYCSVACYRTHGSEDETPSRCTEGFYQQRVSQVVDLEVKEKKNDTLRMLNRVHREQQNQESSVLPSGLPKQELYELLVALETEDDEKLSQFLSRHQIEAAVNQGVEEGRLLEWVLEPWHPWWRPKLSTPADAAEVEDDCDPDLIGGKTLDDLLLSLPPFESFKCGSKVRPELQFNVIDLLYGLAWTFRLYMGPSNAQGVAEESADALLLSSSVLSRDARHGSLQEALVSCISRSTESYQRGLCNAHWKLLAADVALICHHDRLVARGLFEGVGILSEAATLAGKRNDKKQRRELKHAQKKLEFYASWVRANSSALTTMSDDITIWVESWTQEFRPPSLVGR